MKRDVAVEAARGGEVDGTVVTTTLLVLLRVEHAELHLELVAAEGDLVGGLERVVPHASGVLVVLEHEHHGGFGVVRVGVGRGGDDGPVEISRESVLLHLVAWAELREAEGDAAADGLALVEDCVGADEEHLVAAGLAPGGDARTEEVHFRATAVFVREDALREASLAELEGDAAGDGERRGGVLHDALVQRGRAGGREGGVATRCGRGRAKATRRRREAHADSRGSAEGGGHDDSVSRR